MDTTDSGVNTVLDKDDDKTIIRNVSMYSDQWDVIDEINDRFDFRNTSAALRFAINDYKRLRNGSQATQPEAGR